MKDLKIEPMKLIVSIVERGQGRNMIELFNGQRLTHHLQCAGKGTATSEIRDLLGLDGVEKDVIFTVGRGTMVNRVMRDLNNELRGAARSRGIVFEADGYDACNGAGNTDECAERSGEGGYDDGGRHGKQHDSGDGESGLYGGSDGNCEKGRCARRHDYSCTLGRQ